MLWKFQKEMSACFAKIKITRHKKRTTKETLSENRQVDELNKT